MAIEAISGYQFWAGNPKTLNSDQRIMVENLFRRSLRGDYPVRAEMEREQIINDIAHQRGNPNKGVGGPSRRYGQSYRRPIAAIAIKNEMPVGIITTANNTSSGISRHKRLEQLGVPPKIRHWLGGPERQAKHRLNRFVTRRYNWIGLRAFDNELIQQSLESDDVTTVDVLGAMAIKGDGQRDMRQPVSVFPWDGERGWKETLASWELTKVDDSETAVYPFGPHAAPINQEWWKNDASFLMLQAIYEKPDGHAAVVQADQNKISQF